jgi:bifunctional non-homologous end joining protein LigD
MGLNRKGQQVPLPDNISTSIKKEMILDGEIIGDTEYVFDILSLDGEDLTGLPCIERIAVLNSNLKLGKGIVVVETAYTNEEKRAMYHRLKNAKKEGVVFKKKDSPYTAGRPNSGGNQIKFKFYKTATFIVKNVTAGKRSVGLELLDGNVRVFMGKVTIPPNHAVPNIGDLVEVRYLYAYKGGAIFQPTYIGVRTDLDIDAANMKQIIYKAGTPEEEEA